MNEKLAQVQSGVSGLIGWFGFMVLNVTFNNISVIS